MFKKKSITVLLILVVMMGSFSSNVLATSVTNTKDFNGETIYRGVVFGQGPVAELFPNVFPKELVESANNEKSKEVIDILIKDIYELDPQYFDELEKAVYSGNHININSSLEKGGELLTKAIENNQYQIKNIEHNDDGQGLFYVAVLGAVITTVGGYSHALVATGAFGITLYAAIYAETTWWGPDSTTTPKDVTLKKEMLVNQLAEEFSK
ncbi:sporulation delaying protein family toxin [Ornithinibacillus caprae]|uniref:sporulation delaying protein family toxin n=1 Tax=Ornithinibacillus caprae TaxID=2678566 RepID=UPI0018C6F490|nr:sporulation delaying protein family toxin [Ornithinibacillus caprae]